ncbi:MAG: penicillin-binding transpeptidase domain-containing protein [Actinomycetota bacterium]|nr:penicillin-binding transpeptidase domain-containing protein [Actinomycetota bacterium]
MNRALLRLSIACLAMFVLLLININYVQAFESSSLAKEPGNIRVFNQQFQYQRGSILATGDGGATKIAESRLTAGHTGIYQRFYPDSPVYAPVTGYDSIYGATGIEAAENNELSGTAPSLEVHNLVSLITGKPKLGATVALTISPRAQQAAYQQLALSGHSGAVVAIDPRTGAILAMASFPTYDPNGYATLSGTKLNQVDAANRANPSEPLLNRAIEQSYPPGSTFKIITSAAAFSTGKVASTNATVAAPPSLPIGNGHTLINDGGELCGDGNPPIIQAFWMSCNTAFGKLGQQLGGATLARYATLFGANSSTLKIPLPVAASVIPAETDPAFEAFAAIGQHNDQVTPLQEAMLAATIANHGTLEQPYLVKQVTAPDGSSVQTANPTVLSQAVSSSVASEIESMMVQVTQNQAGTAFATANSSLTGGVVIAGKTGTAQNGVNNSGLNDAVFTCFAPASNPQIAVGVIVKGGGFGAAAAAPIAVAVIKAYLKLH